MNILITGASQGLGLELTKSALKRGYRVFAVARHVSPELGALQGANCSIHTADITSAADVDRVYEEISQKTECVDYLFNNAGVWLDKSRVSLTDPLFSFDDVFRQFEVNAVGSLRVTRTFLPMLLVGSGKCIINLSSEAGSIGNAGRKCEYGYCMSKAALNMETKILQNAYPELRFYAIHPGWMKTPQGYAGATKDCTPQQEPSDTAEKLLTLAETKKYPYLYGDFEGNPMPW